MVVKQRYVSNFYSFGPTRLRLRLWTGPFFDVGNFFESLFGLGENFDTVTILTRCAVARGDVTISTHLVSSAVGQF